MTSTEKCWKVMKVKGRGEAEAHAPCSLEAFSFYFANPKWQKLMRLDEKWSQVMKSDENDAKW